MEWDETQLPLTIIHGAEAVEPDGALTLAGAHGSDEAILAHDVLEVYAGCGVGRPIGPRAGCVEEPQRVRKPARVTEEP